MNIMEIDKLPEEVCTTTTKPDPVVSMEVCTLAVAKALKIDDPTYYFKDGYENTKTHNKKFDDNSDTDRYHSLCNKGTIDKNKSYPNCAVQHGFGFSTNLQNKETQECIAFECPPGFTKDKNGCIKPKTIIDEKPQSEFCEEKWYDWFMVPNYHLGNKYVKINDKCYQPCNPGFVPSFGSDPVDGYSPGLGATDRPDMCANKDTYLGGKYNTPQNYCPLAVIKRLSSTRESLTKNYNNVVKNNYDEKDLELDPVVKKNKFDGKIITVEVDDMINKIHSKLEDIYPASQNDIVACRTLITDDRVGEAYNICKTLDENADYYLTSMREEGVSLPTAQLKVSLLKKACHSLFCNKNDNPIASVSNTVYKPDPDDPDNEVIIETDKTFCFPDAANDKDIQALVQNNNKSGASRVNLENIEKKETPTKSFVDIYKDIKTPIYSDVTDKMILSLKIIPNIIAFVVLVYVIYIFFKETTLGQNIWKYIKKILHKIWNFLTAVSSTTTTTEQK